MEPEALGYTRPCTTRRSVLNVDRKVTNKICGIIFFITFGLWIVSIIYGVAVPVESTRTVFEDFNVTRVFTLIGFILFSAVLTLIIFIALRWIPHVSSVILGIFWIPVPVFILAAISATSFWSVHSAVGAILACFFILVLLKTEWFHMSEAVLKEACRMIISVPSTCVFSLVALILGVFAIGITFAIIIRLTLGNASFFSIFVMLIMVFSVCWILSTILILSWMTLSGTFAEYYYTENKGSISFGTVWRLFILNCRYHIGTAAMYYPLLGGLRALYFVAALGLSEILDGPSKTEICFIIYNIFDFIMLRIVYLGGVTESGINGNDYDEAGSQAQIVFSSNPKRFLTVVKVTELLLGISSGLVMVLTVLTTVSLYANGQSLDDGKGESIQWQQIFILLMIVGAAVFIATLLTCIFAASYTIMLCLNEIAPGVGASPESGVTNSRLHSALNHDGPPNWFKNTCSCIPDFEYN